METGFVDREVFGPPLLDAEGVPVNDSHVDVRIMEGHYGCCRAAWMSDISWRQNVPFRRSYLPTYPAPMQQMFLTAPPFAWRAVSRDALLLLTIPRPEAASSRASCSFKACRTGLKVKLPSGVVGAVDTSTRLSSDSMLEEGFDGFLHMEVAIWRYLPREDEAGLI